MKQLIRTTYLDDDGKLYDQDGSEVVDTHDPAAIIAEIRDTVTVLEARRDRSLGERLNTVAHLQAMCAHLVTLWSADLIGAEYKAEARSEYGG
jgi:hypothetical protein